MPAADTMARYIMILIESIPASLLILSSNASNALNVLKGFERFVKGGGYK